MHPEEVCTKKIFQGIVLKSKGSVVLLRSVRNKMSATSRPSIEDAVQQLDGMKEEGLGDVVTTNKTRAFIKHTPERVNKDALTEYGIDLELYKKTFLTADMDLQPRLKTNLLQLSTIGKEVQDYEEANKENNSS